MRMESSKDGDVTDAIMYAISVAFPFFVGGDLLGALLFIFRHLKTAGG